MPLTPNQIRALLWALIAVVSALLLSPPAPVLMPFLLAAVCAEAAQRIQQPGIAP